MLTFLVTILIMLLVLLDILVSSDFQNRKNDIDTFNKVQSTVTTITELTYQSLPSFRKVVTDTIASYVSYVRGFN